MDGLKGHAAHSGAGRGGNDVASAVPVSSRVISLTLVMTMVKAGGRHGAVIERGLRAMMLWVVASSKFSLPPVGDSDKAVVADGKAAVGIVG